MNIPNRLTEQLNRLQAQYPDVVIQLEIVARQQREQGNSSFHFSLIDDQDCLAYEQTESGKQWIHGPESPQQQAVEWLKPLGNHASDMVIVWRMGLGYVPRMIQELNPNTKMIVCENRLELIWESFCRWDNHCLLEPERCLLMTDHCLLDAMVQLIKQYPLLFPSNTHIIPGSVFNNHDWDNVAQIQEALRSSISKKQEHANNQSVCLMSNSPDTIFPAVQRGIESAGYPYIQAQRPSALSGLLKNRIAWKDTCGCIPKVALAFYGSIFSHQELMDMGKYDVKRVCWFYDRMYDLEPSISECYDLALTFDRKHIEHLQPVFGSRVRYLPAATGMETFQSNGNLKPSTPISFVGATGLRRSMQYIEQNRLVSTQLLNIINRVISTGWGLSPIEVQEQLDAETQSLNPDRDPKFTRFVLQLAASRLRASFLTAAQPFGLTIYGDALWGKREISGNLTQAYAGYSLHYETQTPEIYASSAINLNLFHPQIIEGIPMRVYDVLACEGFLLSQYRPVLEEQFTIGKDLDVFHHPGELAEKIQYYLQHEDLRLEMAKHGRETVLKRHTYRHRIQQIMEWLDYEK